MRALAFAVLVVASSCQTYEFNPVEPMTLAVSTDARSVHGKPPLPRLMLAVDTSGSMDFELTSEQRCTTPGCVTRWSELNTAVDAFLTSAGNHAHLGLLPFPVGGACGGGSSADVSTSGVHLDVSRDDDAASRAATVANIRTVFRGLSPSGGTPTAATLRGLADYAPLTNPESAASYVLLLTDGLPNCNQDFSASGADCLCTATGALQPANMCGAPTTNACLDDQGTVAAIAALRAKDVKTIVVGFGPSTTTGAGPATLSAMAAAGGFQRPCTVDAECGAADTCSVTTTSPCGEPMRACARNDFQAANAQDLARVLDAVQNSIVCFNPCLLPLTVRPENEAWLSVVVDGVSAPRGPDTWRYLAPVNTVELMGNLCARVRAATPDAALNVEVRLASVP